MMGERAILAGAVLVLLAAMFVLPLIDRWAMVP